MKMFSAVLFVSLSVACLADLSIFTKDDWEFFKNLKFEQLPRNLQLAIRKTTRSGGDSSNWCCTNDIPVKTVAHSKIESHTVKVTAKVKIGYTKCKFMGMGMCALYDIRYQDKMTYVMTYLEVPDPHECAEVDLKCCKGYIPFAGNCVGFDELDKYQGTLAKLKQNGLINLVG